MPTNRPAKTMSSGLLTMKFMQRAAASNSSTPAQTSEGKPGARQHEESDESDPSPKRQRLSSQRDSHNTSELEAISAAIKSEEDKRAAAIARQAAEAGETQWVLEFPTGTVPPVSSKTNTASNNDLAEADDDVEFEGRRDYGGFKSKKRNYPPPPVKVSEAPKTTKRDVDVDKLPDSISGNQSTPSNRSKGNGSRKGFRSEQ